MKEIKELFTVCLTAEGKVRVQLFEGNLEPGTFELGPFEAHRLANSMIHYATHDDVESRQS